MTSGLITGSALALGILVLVLCIGIGLFGFKPERAQAIREGEAEGSSVVIEEIRRVHVGPPDRFRRGRIDRHPFYIGPMIAAMGYSACVLAGASVTNNVASLSDTQLFTMGACFLIGSTLALSGAAMGARVGRWQIASSVRDHIAAARLGDDIRLPYTFAGIGMFPMGISAGIYSATSFTSTVGSLGGWLSGLLAGQCALMLCVYYRRTRQYTRTLKAVVNEAVANVISRGGHESE